MIMEKINSTAKTNDPSFSKQRIEAFSDGVIAIIITLLVLEIKVPHLEGDISTALLFDKLTKLTPKFLSWALSFFMVLIMWVNHHRIFEELKSSSYGLVWLNGMLLFFMSFVPFPTAFLGDYFNQPLSSFFFGICLFFMGLSFGFLRMYIYKNSFLLKDAIDLKLYKKIIIRTFIFGPLIYLTGALISFVSVNISYILYASVPLYFVTFSFTRTS